MKREIEAHFPKPDKFSGFIRGKLKTFKSLEDEIENLFAWISRDDGTGLYQDEIEWAIKDLIVAARR